MGKSSDTGCMALIVIVLICGVIALIGNAAESVSANGAFFFAIVATILAIVFAGLWTSKLRNISPAEVEKQQATLAKEFERQKKDLIRQSTAGQREIEKQRKQLTKTEAQLKQKFEKENQVIEKRGQSILDRYVKDSIRGVISKITVNNFTSSKGRIEKVFAFCEKQGARVSDQEREVAIADSKARYEFVLRADFQKKEQARIKAQIRDEEKLRRDVERQIADTERERKMLEKAINEAMNRLGDEHSQEVELLREKLREAVEKGQRAQSMAQLTKAGHVYVISNIGSFGNEVFKIGMTRRLEPLDRVRELGDASVPFPYDVHMMISTNDAPSLEKSLHRELHRHRLNKVNLRREFFRSDIEVIAGLVEKCHGKVEYIAEPEALQYNQSIAMSEEDFDFMTHEIAEIEGSEDFSKTSHDTKSNDSEESDAQLQVAEDVVIQPEETTPCPMCEGVIVIATISAGENTCPHCEGIFETG